METKAYPESSQRNGRIKYGVLLLRSDSRTSRVGRPRVEPTATETLRFGTEFSPEVTDVESAGQSPRAKLSLLNRAVLLPDRYSFTCMRSHWNEDARITGTGVSIGTVDKFNGVVKVRR